MSISRRRFGALTLGAFAAVGSGVARAAATEPSAVVKALYDALLDSMKQGKTLGFDGRYKKLEPVIHQTFDVATMCKIAVGPYWTQLATDKKNAVLVAF